MKLKLWYSLLLSIFLTGAIATRAKSQITPDGTTNTTVNSTDSTIIIEQGDRAGDNLFHSFGEFDLPNGSEAFFNNQSDIINIFSRVTGGDISNIEGLIRANGDANLFLINPAGIVFGEGAALDIGGSFTATTAESVVFSDNVEFAATDSDNPPLLTVNMPIGLNYGSNPGNIAVNQSNLEVNKVEALSLLGGDVTITGGEIIAPGGNVNLGGISQVGRVSFEIIENGINFDTIALDEAIARADITLTNGASVNVQATGGGNIRVNARNLELSGGEFGASNLKAGIAAGTNSSETQAGNIVIDVIDNITADGGSSIINSVEESAVGDAGAIDIATNNLFLSQGSRIEALTLAQGDTGAINIEANGTISAEGQGQVEADRNSGIFNQVRESAVGNSGGINITTNNLTLTQNAKVDASTLGQGDGGEIDITTNNLFLTEGGQIFASTLFGGRDAGQIIIQAEGNIEADGTNSGILSLATESTTGNSGGINITTNNLKLAGGAEVNASTLAGSQGDAGDIIIQADGNIEADGIGQDGFSSGIFSVVDAVGIGNPSEINLTTTNLKLTGGAEVNASNFFGQRDAGGINITTNNLSLTEGAQINANTSDRGDGGLIDVKANDTIEANGERQASDGSFISSGIFSLVKQFAQGNSGGINITTTNLKLTGGAEVNASTPAGVDSQGDAGSINIQANGTIEADGRGLDGFNSGIFSVVDAVGTGNPGGINITTTNLKLIEGAEVNASTFFGQRDAGGIDITTNNLLLTEGARINASTFGQGNGGAINIQANGTIEADGRGIDGSSSGIFSQPEESSVGNAGGIDINTMNLFLMNGAEISVRSRGRGNAGNLEIQADSLSLESQASLFASTSVGSGGNIELEIAENLTLQDNSTISARALENANGGNITIDADFIIAFINQNNDIIASADEGTGGEINITTNSIFGGLEERSSTVDNQTNDLDASSELGLDGIVQINEFEVNPTEALEELPTEVIDETESVAQNLCQQGRGSEFIVTGKGGVAPSPTQARDRDVGSVDLVKPVFSSEAGGAGEAKDTGEIVEAQGWIVNDRGMVELVASKTNIDRNPPQPKVQCHK